MSQLVGKVDDGKVGRGGMQVDGYRWLGREAVNGKAGWGELQSQRAQLAGKAVDSKRWPGRDTSRRTQ